MKQFIKNRKWEKISVLVEEKENNNSIAFVMHGLWWFKEQDHIRTFINAFLDNNISVISFDTTNAFWESDWNYENATTTNYYEDLEDVINWSKTQSFYKEPFYLVWHSLWWIGTSLYTQKYPNEVKALAPISSVISWQMSIDITPKEELNKWRDIWYKIKESKSKPWVIKKLKYSHFKDRVKYNILPEAYKLTMPVLLIVWEEDDSTPLSHQKMLFEKLSGKKELHIIKWAGHTFREENELKEIYNIFDEWIKNIN